MLERTNVNTLRLVRVNEKAVRMATRLREPVSHALLLASYGIFMKCCLQIQKPIFYRLRTVINFRIKNCARILQSATELFHSLALYQVAIVHRAIEVSEHGWLNAVPIEHLLNFLFYANIVVCVLLEQWWKMQYPYSARLWPTVNILLPLFGTSPLDSETVLERPSLLVGVAMI
jgi:hypothetical protein